MKTLLRPGLVALVPIVVVLTGCSHRYEGISGRVTFHGMALDEGSVQFFTGAGAPRVAGGARIVNGEFEVPASHGLNPGEYLVRISSTELTTNSAGDSFRSRISVRERIPARYNTQSSLRVEVRAGERKELTFELD